MPCPLLLVSDHGTTRAEVTVPEKTKPCQDSRKSAAHASPRLTAGILQCVNLKMAGPLATRGHSRAAADSVSERQVPALRILVTRSVSLAPGPGLVSVALPGQRWRASPLGSQTAAHSTGVTGRHRPRSLSSPAQPARDTASGFPPFSAFWSAFCRLTSKDSQVIYKGT